jgi:hypothetical protein
MDLRVGHVAASNLVAFLAASGCRTRKCIRATFEARGLLVPEQAGFRNREECMGQVLTLVEVAKRRRIQSQQPTYACFIDFQKAFDTVPHEALLMMSRMGVTGKCLDFFRALYDHSWMRIRTRGGNELFEPVPLHRGVRQGDPASSLLFNIFINDLLTNCEAFGVQVPWVPDERDPTKNRCLSGLMFADDFFWVRSRLSVKSDSVHTCTETVFIFQEILRAKSDSSASMQFDR